MTVHALPISRRANQAVDAPLSSTEEAAMIAAASQKIGELLDILRIDHRNDHKHARHAAARSPNVREGILARPFLRLS